MYCNLHTQRDTFAPLSLFFFVFSLSFSVEKWHVLSPWLLPPQLSVVALWQTSVASSSAQASQGITRAAWTAAGEFNSLLALVCHPPVIPLSLHPSSPVFSFPVFVLVALISCTILFSTFVRKSVHLCRLLTLNLMKHPGTILQRNKCKLTFYSYILEFIYYINCFFLRFRDPSTVSELLNRACSWLSGGAQRESRNWNGDW